MLTVSNDTAYRPHDSLFTDEALARRIDLFLSASFRPADVRVTVSAGRVHLQGTIGTLRQRELIESYSRRVAGVLEVRNDLVIFNRANQPSPFKPFRREQRSTPRPGPKPAAEPRAPKPKASTPRTITL